MSDAVLETSNISDESQPKESFASRAQELSQRIESKVDTAIKAVKAFKRAQAIWAFLVASPWIIVIIIVLVVGFIAIRAIRTPSKDTFDFATQCLLSGQSAADHPCLTFLGNKMKENYVPADPTDTGAITSPTPTYPAN